MYSYYKNVEILNKSFRNYSARTKQIQRKLTNQSEYYNYQKFNKRYIIYSCYYFLVGYRSTELYIQGCKH
jgi:hypothetical protein